MNRKKLLITFATVVAFALMVWTIGATVNLTAINFSASSGDVVSASDFNSAFGTVDANFADVESAINNNRSGVANTQTQNDTVLTSTTQEVASVTIDAPGPGVIDVRAHGFFWVDHLQGGGDDIPRAYLSTASATSDFDNLAIFTVDSDQPSNFEYYSTFSIALIDTVSSAGSYTYYLNGDIAFESQASASQLGNPHLVATFHPAAHGSVTATSADAGPTETTGGAASEPSN